MLPIVAICMGWGLNVTSHNKCVEQCTACAKSEEDGETLHCCQL